MPGFRRRALATTPSTARRVTIARATGRCGRGVFAGHGRQRLVQGLLSPVEECVEVVGGERALRPWRQPVTAERLVEDRVELGAHLLEVGGWWLLGDTDVRGAIDEAVVEDRIHCVPLPDAPQVWARKDAVVIDLARFDERGGEWCAHVEVARMLQQGQRHSSPGTVANLARWRRPAQPECVIRDNARESDPAEGVV
jgi:hypothetical protein